MLSSVFLKVIKGSFFHEMQQKTGLIEAIIVEVKNEGGSKGWKKLVCCGVKIF